jgi:hypothetical protein
MPTHNSLYWQYININCPPLPDPRIQVTRHMAWQMPTDLNLYGGVEPDNYNFCIFDDKPYDLKFIKHQCWYKIDQNIKRKRITGWFGLYVAEERLQSILFNREILKLQPQAVWRYDKAKLIRPKKTQLQREKFHHNSKGGILTTEERLYQQGYYEKLKNKYFDDEALFKVVGTPRGVVLNPEPEVLDYDGF